jgi:hypothetical protein
MDRARQVLSGPGGLFVRMLFLIIGFYLLYLVYRFFYDISQYNDNTAINTVIVARDTGKGPSKQSFTATQKETPIVKIATGSEFSVSYWMYVADTSYLPQKNKFIFSFGPDPDTLTTSDSLSIVAYLTAFNYSLAIRTNSKQSGASSTPLNSTVISSLFDSTITTPTDISNPLTPCDIASVDLQKWVHVTIVYSSKTLDVYMDGKLARSCILPNTITISSQNKLTLFAKGGFGGYVSNFRTHDYSLNPEQIWRLYMSGPGPTYSLLDYIKSLWDPTAVGTLSYPKITDTL